MDEFTNFVYRVGMPLSRTQSVEFGDLRWTIELEAENEPLEFGNAGYINAVAGPTTYRMRILHFGQEVFRMRGVPDPEGQVMNIVMDHFTEFQRHLNRAALARRVLSEIREGLIDMRIPEFVANMAVPSDQDVLDQRFAIAEAELRTLNTWLDRIGEVLDA